MSNQLVFDAKKRDTMGSMVASAHHSSANSYGLRHLTRVLTQRRYWIIGSILVCLLLVAILTMMMRPTYASIATIELNKGGSGALDLGVGDDALSQQLTSGADSLLTDLQTETAILQGDSLALAVIQRLKSGLPAAVRRQETCSSRIKFRAGITARKRATDADAVVAHFPGAFKSTADPRNPIDSGHLRESRSEAGSTNRECLDRQLQESIPPIPLQRDHRGLGLADEAVVRP